MEAKVERAALVAAMSAMARPRRSGFRLDLMTIEVRQGSVRVGFEDGGFCAVTTMPAEVQGSAAFCVGERLLRSIVQGLPTGDVRLTHTANELTIESGHRLRFAVYATPSPDPLPSPAQVGVVVRAREYLRAFRRVVAVAGGDREVFAPIRITSDTDDVWMDFHTFDAAARARVPGRAGTLGERPVLVQADDLAQLVARFPNDDSLVRVVDAGSRLWISDETSRAGAVVAASVVCADDRGRNADPFLDLEHPNEMRVTAVDLRAALRRCDVVLQGRGTGRYVTFRVGFDPERCRILTQSWLASAADEIPCRFTGAPSEFAVARSDLTAAIKSTRGALKISFDDPERFVLITERLIYRALIRALGPSHELGPRHWGVSDNVPFPT